MGFGVSFFFPLFLVVVFAQHRRVGSIEWSAHFSQDSSQRSTPAGAASRGGLPACSCVCFCMWLGKVGRAGGRRSRLRSRFYVIRGRTSLRRSEKLSFNLPMAILRTMQIRVNQFLRQTSVRRGFKFFYGGRKEDALLRYKILGTRYVLRWTRARVLRRESPARNSRTFRVNWQHPQYSAEACAMKSSLFRPHEQWMVYL